MHYKGSFKKKNCCLCCSCCYQCLSLMTQCSEYSEIISIFCCTLYIMLSCSLSVVYKFKVSLNFVFKTRKWMDVSQSVPQGAFHKSSDTDGVLQMTQQLLAWKMSSYWNVIASADPDGIDSSMEEQAGKKPFHIQQVQNESQTLTGNSKVCLFILKHLQKCLLMCNVPIN